MFIAIDYRRVWLIMNASSMSYRSVLALERSTLHPSTDRPTCGISAKSAQLFFRDDMSHIRMRLKAKFYFNVCYKQRVHFDNSINKKKTPKFHCHKCMIIEILHHVRMLILLFCVLRMACSVQATHHLPLSVRV